MSKEGGLAGRRKQLYRTKYADNGARTAGSHSRLLLALLQPFLAACLACLLQICPCIDMNCLSNLGEKAFSRSLCFVPHCSEGCPPSPPLSLHVLSRLCLLSLPGCAVGAIIRLKCGLVDGRCGYWQSRTVSTRRVIFSRLRRWYHTYSTNMTSSYGVQSTP